MTGNLRSWRVAAAGVVMLMMTGCGSRGLVPVKGIVQLDGQPVRDAVVRFHAVEVEKGNGGFGVTDSSGRFSARVGQGPWGLYPGSYKVTLSRKQLPEGTPLDPKTPAECEAWQRAYDAATDAFPGHYTSPQTTPLQTVVSIGQKPLELSVTGSAGGR